MALVGSLADILPDSPLSAGKNRDSTRAGLYPPMRGAASRVMRKYGSWSMAHGMRQRSDFFSAPNMCGKQSGNAGAACVGGKPIWPMLDSPEKPKMPRAALNVTHLAIFSMLR